MRERDEAAKENGQEQQEMSEGEDEEEFDEQEIDHHLKDEIEEDSQE